jgi:hypothetical protein
MMSIGMRGDLNLFINLKTNHVRTSRSFMVFNLPKNMNAYTFLQIESPPFNTGGIDLQTEVEHATDTVIAIDGLDAHLAGAGAATRTVVTAAYGTKVPSVYVVDKGSGLKYVCDAEGKLAPVPDADGMVTTIHLDAPAEPSLQSQNTARQREVARLTSQPKTFEGRELYKQFFRDDGSAGEYHGRVTLHYTIRDEGHRWRVLYEDTTTEEFTLDQMIHHVVDGWVSVLGAPKSKAYRRTDHSMKQALLGLHAAPAVGEIDGATVGLEPVGGTDGDTDGVLVLGDVVGLPVGSELVGELVGEMVGFAAVGELEGDTVVLGQGETLRPMDQV